MNRGAWWATAHTVAKAWTGLKQLGMHTHKKLTDLENELTVARGKGEEGTVREFGHVHTTVFEMDNQQEPAV